MIIGLTGKARSGKDTFANAIVFKYRVRKIAFADALKASTKALFKFSDDQLFVNKDREDEYWEITPREVLQDLGLYYREKYGESFLIYRLQLDITDEHYYVIPDVRFENEAKWIREQGIIVHVRRPGAKRVREHESEKELIVYDQDYVVHNANTEANFMSNAIKFYRNEIIQEGYKEKLI